ncbi:MAG: methylamine utilization protein [Elusimicrobia bacterium]|nr:methylamine utilization protein [Elusimicrobiota bacterium]
MNSIALASALSLFAAQGASAADGAKRKTVLATVIDDKGAPVEDAVVHVVLPGTAAFKPPSKVAVMDQVDRDLVPRVLPVLVGTGVTFPNKDDIHHELYSFSAAKKFELPLYKGKPAKPVVFDKPGVVKLGCNIHDWMSAVIVVLDNPYFAKTDATGTARVPVPAGAEATLAVYHDRDKGTEKATETVVKLAGDPKASWTLSLKNKPKKMPKVSSEY